MTPAPEASRAGVVLTGGVFDLLHVGHVRLLERARSLGTRLVVAVQHDDAVCAIPGKRRPVNPVEERAEMVSALRCVDEVVVYHSGVDGGIVRQVRPGILVHGDDWHDQADRTLVLRALDEVGGRLVLLSRTPGVSTSGLRWRIADAASNA